MDDQNEPIEATIVEDKVSDDNQATVLISLEEMIKKNISRLDQLKNEVKKQREMYDDSFLNNPTFIENTEKAKTATKDLLVTKKNIASQPSVIQISLKLRSMRDETKEI